MDNSREISILKYLEFSFMYECEEDLKSFIVVCVHIFFVNYFQFLNLNMVSKE
jgi:hypothetical protein